MRVRREIIILGILLTLMSYTGISICKGQSASAELGRTSIDIGDQIPLTLTFTGPSNLKVNFPQFADTLANNVVIVNKGKVKSTLSPDKKTRTYSEQLTITSFDSGYFAIPPIRVNYAESNDTAQHNAETQPLLLNVQTLKVNMQKGIRDIKPPLVQKFTFREALPYILGFIVFVLAIVFLIYYLRKRKKKEPIFKLPSKPKLPPHEIALAALEDLRNKKLWQNNKVKEFHSELTDIIRTYIADRFQIPAMEMISDDILESVNKIDADAKTKSELRELLNLADLVKFAKENPLPSEHDKSFNNALDFVKGTIIQITTNTETEKTGDENQTNNNQQN